jgi:excisionase family DNA binding protein
MAQTEPHHDNPVQGQHQLLVPAEAAEFMRISIGQLYHLTSERRIPFLKVGGQLRFEVEALLEHMRRPSSTVPGSGRSGNKNAARRGTNRVIRLDEGATEQPFRFKTPSRRH